MTILVTGANGQLGNEMRIVACKSADKFIFTDVTQASEEQTLMLHRLAGDGVDVSTSLLDITDIDAVRTAVREQKVDAIVNCAAYTNVDAAESNEALAEKLNADAPENLALVMKEAGGVLVQISTDYVFGREPYNTPCREDQKGTPTGVYGMTKLHGEQKIMAVGCRYVIIRTAWLYSEFGKNFCKTMLSLTATKPQLKVVFDQVGTPTYAWDLANVIMTALARPVTGVYHFSNEGVCSWYDFTKMIAEYSAQTDCDVQPCHSNEFPSPVKRPSFSVLDKTKIKETYGITVPYWTDSLKVCLRNLAMQ
ncbi:MAG: dTDP-4-dehydrorhamnose reductase [Bacteroidaceae bacterium]|nr:dTDP-4-dehydrorhamnose reductase [Bacteroidaceae bacterium]